MLRKLRLRQKIIIMIIIKNKKMVFLQKKSVFLRGNKVTFFITE